MTDFVLLYILPKSNIVVMWGFAITWHSLSICKLVTFLSSPLKLIGQYEPQELQELWYLLQVDISSWSIKNLCPIGLKFKNLLWKTSLNDLLVDTNNVNVCEILFEIPDFLLI